MTLLTAFLLRKWNNCRLQKQMQHLVRPANKSQCLNWRILSGFWQWKRGITKQTAARKEIAPAVEQTERKKYAEPCWPLPSCRYSSVCLCIEGLIVIYTDKKPRCLYNRVPWLLLSSHELFQRVALKFFSRGISVENPPAYVGGFELWW